jgi:hypothetical protein
MDSSPSERHLLSGPKSDRWLIGVALFFGLLFFGIQLAEIPWRSALRGYDNTFNYLWLRSAMVDGDWDFRNDLEECDTIAESELGEVLNQPVTKTGLLANKYGIGWGIASLPGYLAADAVVAVGNGVGLWDLRRDGFNPVYQVFLQAWQFLLAAVSLVLVRTVVARLIGPEYAWAGVLSVWLASPLVYYQTSNLSMSHNTVFFCIAVMVFGAMQAPRKPGAAWPWLLMGAGYGLAVVTRFQAGVFAFVLIFALWEHAKSRRELVLQASGWLLAGGLPFALLQMWAWKVVYGQWAVFSYGVTGESFSWGSPALVQSLFSSFHGMFYWHPLLFVSFAGMMWWTWRRRGVGIPLTMAGVLTVYVNAAWWCWWFAASFGMRAFDGALIGLMIGQAYLFSRANKSRLKGLWATCIVLAAWNLYVVTLFRAAAIPRNAPVTWLEMIRAALELPEHLHF